MAETRLSLQSANMPLNVACSYNEQPPPQKHKSGRCIDVASTTRANIIM
jgi:hypothetical protein